MMNIFYKTPLKMKNSEGRFFCMFKTMFILGFCGRFPIAFWKTLYLKFLLQLYSSSKCSEEIYENNLVFDDNNYTCHYAKYISEAFYLDLCNSLYKPLLLLLLSWFFLFLNIYFNFLIMVDIHYYINFRCTTQHLDIYVTYEIMAPKNLVLTWHHM